jgi:hypothetical protein
VFQSSLSLFSCIIERQGLGKHWGKERWRGGERGDQIGMKSKEVPNKKALFVGMVWQNRSGVGRSLDMAY